MLVIITKQKLDCNNGYAPIAGVTGQTFVPNSDGSYAVELDDNVCIDTSACYTVTGVGLDENTLLGLHMFPNPARGFVVLSHKGLPEQGQYMIFDISGRVIIAGAISKSAAEQVIPLNMAAGVYAIWLRAGRASTVQKLIVY